MRIVAWKCNMAFDRKFTALARLAPDIAVISECAEPERLLARGRPAGLEGEPIWIGRNPHKGLAIFAFNGYSVRLIERFHETLRYIAPIRVSGPCEFNLVAVWAQNASAGLTRKFQLGPLRRGLSKYRELLQDRDAVLAGDLNNNAIWHRPGWRMNHGMAVATLRKYGLVSAYHELRREEQGRESESTLYWRDRKKDGPTYHIDYVFVPEHWISCVRELSIGSYEEWCGSGLSDHVPVVVDIDRSGDGRLSAGGPARIATSAEEE